MIKPILLLLVLVAAAVAGSAQDTTRIANDSVQVINGDTVTLVDVRPVVIFPPVAFSSHRASVRYDKLVRNVKKVYPYAKAAGKQLAFYKSVLDTIPGERARKLYMKQAEKELEAKFGKEIRDLTFSQGKILIKLIYRETGNSTFDIVKDLRGGFTAFIWQTMARIFGYDLKSPYDPEGTDQAIEQIVLMIEAGAL